MRNPTVDIYHQFHKFVTCLNRPSGPGQSTPLNCSILLLAAIYDHDHLIKLLLSETSLYYGKGLAYVACRSNAVKVVKYLLDTKHSFSLQKAIHWSILCNSTEVLKLLLAEKNAQVAQEDIMVALLKVGSLDLARMLISHPSFALIKEKMFEEPVPLLLDDEFSEDGSDFIVTEWLELVRYLINDPHVDLGAFDNILLKAYTYSIDLLEFLLEQPSVDPSAGLNLDLYPDDFNQPMLEHLLASSRITEEQVKEFLIDCCRCNYNCSFELTLHCSSIDVTFNDNICLKTALENDGPTIVKLILQETDSLSSIMVFFEASKFNATQVMSCLLEQMDDETFKNYADTILNTVIENGNTETFEFLLSFNYSFNLQSALEYVCSMDSRTEILKLLLEDTRVDPSADNSQALHIASMMGRKENVEILLQDKRVVSYLLEHKKM